MTTPCTTRPPLPDRRGGVWSYVSPSRLHAWLACPLRFKLLYVQGIRLPTTASLFLGKTVHAILETYYRQRQQGIRLSAADLARWLSGTWDQRVAEEAMPFASAAEEQALRSQALELTAAYLRQLPPEEPAPLTVEATVEAPLIDPLTGEDLGIPLLGIMDLVLEGAPGPTIVDFKTAARAGAPLEITHEIQLTSYAYLLRQAQGRAEAGLEIRSLIKTKVPRVEIHRYPPRSAAHFRRLFAVVRAYLDDLHAGRFVFRPGLGCSMCELYQEHCGRWPG